MNQPRRALLSVSDKTGIVEFAQSLVDLGFQLLSTGGTANALRAAGVAVTDVSEVTGHPEIMEGRVKTLHPAIHGGILARRDVAGDMEALAAQGYGPIDIVAVNLYPFRETIAAGGVTVEAAMKQVDVGGPTMIRAAAKNHAHVWVVVDPRDYPRVLAAVREGGAGAPLRRELAAKVFHHTAGYDAAIATFIDGEATPFPERLHSDLERVSSLRYGENPDQRAAFYAPEGAPRRGIAALHQHHGKELSYNNLLDLDGALLALSPFALSPRPAVAIVKHTTPCGIGVGDSLLEAYERAFRTDPVSAFGSVIALNREVDGAAAAAIGEIFTECVVAPAFSGEALGILTAKKNLRLLTYSEPFEPEPIIPRGIYGGVLYQTPAIPPQFGVEDSTWKVVTERRPTVEEAQDLAFAWSAVYSVKSNAILLARGGATLGIGAGQMSRVDASKLAVRKADEAGFDLGGAVLASDAFFPFRDGVDAAAAAGIRAIIQPGGSVRDEEVIRAADEAGIAMIFTGRRLFRH